MNNQRRLTEQAIHAIRMAREHGRTFERYAYLGRGNEAFAVITCVDCGQSNLDFKLSGFPVMGNICRCYPTECISACCDGSQDQVEECGCECHATD